MPKVTPTSPLNQRKPYDKSDDIDRGQGILEMLGQARREIDFILLPQNNLLPRNNLLPQNNHTYVKTASNVKDATGEKGSCQQKRQTVKFLLPQTLNVTPVREVNTETTIYAKNRKVENLNLYNQNIWQNFLPKTVINLTSNLNANNNTNFKITKIFKQPTEHEIEAARESGFADPNSICPKPFKGFGKQDGSRSLK